MPPRAAFTLLELSVVVALLGLVAALSVVRLSGLITDARFGESTERVADFDRRARQVAKARGRAIVVLINSDTNRLEADYFETDEQGIPALALDLGETARIEAVWTPESGMRGDTRTITIDPDGVSSCYAVRLDSAQDELRWLLIGGASHWTRTYEDKNEALRAFRLLEQKLPQGRRDAGRGGRGVRVGGVALGAVATR